MHSLFFLLQHSINNEKNLWEMHELVQTIQTKSNFPESFLRLKVSHYTMKTLKVFCNKIQFGQNLFIKSYKVKVNESIRSVMQINYL